MTKVKQIASLPRRDYIHWLGLKNYKELSQYPFGWDVGLTNFAPNEATKSISLTKTLEFLAAGLPVVWTLIANVVRPYGERGPVELAKTSLEVVRKAESLLAQPKEACLQKVDRHLAAGSWDKSWAVMHRLMTDAVDAPCRTAPP